MISQERLKQVLTYSRESCDGVRKYLGTFPTKYQAAHAYDEAAKTLHGEFARTNGVA